MLHPDVVLTAERDSASEVVVHGAAAVAGRAIMFANPTAMLVPVLVDGNAGVVVEVAGHTFALMVFVVAGTSVVAIDTTTDAERLATIRRVG